MSVPDEKWCREHPAEAAKDIIDRMVETERLVHVFSVMLGKAEKEFQHAAAMHSTGKTSHCAGQISALKAVLKEIGVN